MPDFKRFQGTLNRLNSMEQIELYRNYISSLTPQEEELLEQQGVWVPVHEDQGKLCFFLLINEGQQELSQACTGKGC